MRLRTLVFAMFLGAAALPCRAADALHSLWELHGKHSTLYLLGSIHVLRQADYPLAPALLEAYRNCKALVMEIDLSSVDAEQVQGEMLAGATLPEEQSLPAVLGARRYAHAVSLAQAVGVDLATFDRFTPWFAAEAISQLQLMELGFQPQSGVEMYFMERARGDGKRIAGLETVQDQIALLTGLSLDTQADYLVSSLEEARSLPREVDDMVHAWQRGNTAWFESHLTAELGHDPALYQSVLAARNRKWIPKIEALLNGDQDTLVIVGTGHLIGPGSVIDLLRKDGFAAIQR